MRCSVPNQCMSPTLLSAGCAEVVCSFTTPHTDALNCVPCVIIEESQESPQGTYQGQNQAHLSFQYPKPFQHRLVGRLAQRACLND